jgi:dolichol-phosphate mannosyltransferase
VLFFPAVFAFLLAHPRYRGQLARREPYLAFLLALVAFSPFLYWNATHRWLTLQFNLVNRQGATGWHPEKMLEYVAGQMIAASPILLLLMVVAVAAVAIRCWPRAGGTRSAPAAEGAVWNDGLLFYAFVVGVPLLIYLGVSFFARVGAHWAGSVFPLATLLLLVWLCRADGPQPRLPIRRRISYALGLAGLALTSLPLIVVVLEPTVLPDRFVYYDEAHDRQALAGNYYGYEAVGRRIDDLGREWAARPEGFFLSTRDYSLAAQLAFYTPGFPQFVLLGYSESAFHGKEYLMWGRGLKKAGANSLFVLDSPIFPNNADRIVPYCGQVRELEPLVIRDGQGRVLRKFFFALCLDYLANEPDHLSRW